MPVRKVDYIVVLIAYFSFIVLGIPGSLIGIVWSPDIRSDFSLELDTVAQLYLVFSIGYFISSFISGRLFSRFSIGLLLALGSGLSALAFAGYALAPAWNFIVWMGLLAGFGAGIVDSGMNIYFAAQFDSRLMNWLHAAFGIGATIAPFIINLILANGGSWRIGYWSIAALYGVCVLLFLFTRSRWLALHADSEQATEAKPTAFRATLALPLVWVGVAIFILFAGIESGAGQWSKSIFFESRGIAETVASSWVGFYWLSFTIGRIAFGFIVERIAASALLRFCMIGSVISIALLVWNPFPESGVIALCLFGFVFGPIFAMLITATQERMGSTHAANAIGFQVAAATIGIGILPGFLGTVGVTFGLESITVALLILVFGMALLYELWRWL